MYAAPFWTSMSWVAAGLLAIIFAYAIVRAASFAHFRTKLEYLRGVLRELNRGGRSDR